MTVKRVHPVEVELPEGRIVVAEFSVEQFPDRNWQLTAVIPGFAPMLVSGGDLLECLRTLKRKTDPDAIRWLCHGARREAWASGMLRDMSGASKVYITKIGLPTTRSDLVPIFGAVARDAVGTVEEQDAYHHAWLNSLNSQEKMKDEPPTSAPNGPAQSVPEKTTKQPA